MESSKTTAYAFMIMFAGMAMISYLGRASAEVVPPGATYGAHQMHGHAQSPAAAGYAPQLGLVQTGMMGVAQMDGAGGFARPTMMPVFQIVQLQPASAMQASYQPAQHAPVEQRAPQVTAAAPEVSVPQGMSVAPQMAGMLCDIKGVQALTQSPDACVAAGGLPLAP